MDRDGRNGGHEGNMATFILIIGVVIFGVGIAGQLAVGRKYAKNHNPGDRKGAQVVLTIAGIIIGAWMIIAAGAALLHSHARAQQQTTNTPG